MADAVRTRSEYACTLNCLNTVRRSVWDGDQLLYEISAPGASGTTAAQMEADTGLAVPFFLNAQHTAVAGWFPYGRVMYEHGGGIDAPLGVVRMEFSDVLHDPQVIFPFHTWRGSYDGGVTQGQCAYYTTNGTQLAPAPDSTPTEGDTQYRVHANSGYGSTAEHCVTVDWPAAFMLSGRQLRRGYAGPDSWMGSLIFESRDASGLYYRRNRYYDSEKQRFTQEDPIGIAGGINLYGFGSGDPLTYSDAFGLASDSIRFEGDKKTAGNTWEKLQAVLKVRGNSGNAEIQKALARVMSVVRTAEQSKTLFIVEVRERDVGWRAFFQGHETCVHGGSKCVIDLDTQTTGSRRDLLLVHELAGAERRTLLGIPHNADDGALWGENAARVLFGCKPAPHHGKGANCK